MPNVKTAVSLEEPLFKRVEALSRELRISRSRLFSLALEEFVRRHESREILERINAVYQEGADAKEVSLQRAMRAQHRRTVEGEW